MRTIVRAIPPLVLLALVSGFSAPSGVHAQTLGIERGKVTFRLDVSGDIPRGMTFWVAYGPPCANFRVVQLHRGPSSGYRVALALAPKRACRVTYLAGYGRVRTPAGFAPGDPVIIIGSVRPADTGFASDHIVHWHPPLG